MLRSVVAWLILGGIQSSVSTGSFQTIDLSSELGTGGGAFMGGVGVGTKVFE